MIRPRDAGAPILLGLILATGVTAAQRVAPPAVDDLLAGAAAYVERFEQEFALVVGDERHQQRIGVRPAPMLPPDKVRTTRSEVVFLWLPHEQMWLTARNVRSLNGRDIPGADSTLQAVLADESARMARMLRLRSESARYNFGPIRRNFNDPTLVLQFAGARLQPRFSWTLEDRETLDDAQTWRIRFKELARPSVIKRGAEDLPASGRVWIEPFTGAIRKTRLDVTDVELKVHVRIETTFGRDEKLTVLAPKRMDESYEQEEQHVFRGSSRSDWAEPINAVATYSNFRRFETSGRLITR
jgi:hypothetical protein